MSEDWIRKMENLNIRDDNLEILREFRNWLKTDSQIQKEIIVSLLYCDEFFLYVDHLAANKKSEDFTIAREVLEICISYLSIGNPEFAQFIEATLRHSHVKIRALALEKIFNELKSPDRAKDIDNELLSHVFRAFCDNDTALGMLAVNILSITLENKLDEKYVNDNIEQALNKNCTTKCRAYGLVVNLAKISPAILGKVECLLDRALMEFNSDDVLVQVNVLEIIVNLAERNHGLLYLEQRHVYDRIAQRVEALDKNPIDNLLLPAILKFFGSSARLQPQKIITSYRQVIMCLLDCLTSNNTSILPAAFDTFANLTTTQQGVLLMETHHADDMKTFLQGYTAAMRNLPSALKNRAFKALEIMFTMEGVVSSELNDLLQKWFHYLSGDNTMQFLMEFCRNPFPDIKIACLGLISALCRYQWGLGALKGTAGFVEFLLDRNIEFDKDAKYMKFQVLKLLSDSNVALDTHIRQQLQLYVNQGPYFVQANMEVAIEES